MKKHSMYLHIMCIHTFMAIPKQPRKTLRVVAAEIGWLSGGPGFAPELTAAVHGQRFAGHKSSRGRGEVDAGLRNIPRRTRAHHRIRAGVGRSGLRRVDVPAFGLDRA